MQVVCMKSQNQRQVPIFRLYGRVILQTVTNYSLGAAVISLHWEIGSPQILISMLPALLLLSLSFPNRLGERNSRVVMCQGQLAYMSVIPCASSLRSTQQTYIPAKTYECAYL